MGGEIQFDSYIGFYGDTNFEAGDAPTLSGHATAGDASTFSEHTKYHFPGMTVDVSKSSEHDFVGSTHSVYYSAWDTGISQLKPPDMRKLAHCRNLLRRTRCRTLIMEIFAGAMILTALASSAGWACSAPVDIIHDGLDLTRESDRQMIDKRIAEDDPFCVVFPFPCGPWNSLTEFNAVRFPAVREHVDHMREEHLPMLRWVARKARERVQLGRLALIENPATSRALKLDFLEALDGLEDGLLAEVLFEYIIGD